MPSAGTPGSAPPPDEYSDPIKLFNRPLWKDPAIFVGWAITIVAAGQRLVANGQEGLPNSTFGIVSGLIDGVLFLGFYFFILCLLPALIRKLVRRSRLKKPPASPQVPGFYPDPVRRGQERWWDGTQWTVTARGGKPPRSGAIGTLVLLIGGALLLGIVALGAFASSSTSRANEVAVARSYQSLLSAVSTFESGAEEAAQSGGPSGLAEFVIANGDTVQRAAEQLQSEWINADLPADYWPDPALLMNAAQAGYDYGEDLRLLAADLRSCTANDVACYQSAFSASDARAETARRDLYNIANTIQEQSRGG